MRRSDDNQDRVMYRGPVSGTGKALSDEDALQILDERVDPAEGEVPDIGIVIERPGSEEESLQGQQQLGLAKGVEKFQDTLRVLDELQRHPGASTGSWSKASWTEGCPMCRHSTHHHPIVKADLGTKLPLLIDTSFGGPGMKGVDSPSYDFPVRLRVLFGDSIFDVSVEPKDLDQPDLTVRDLLARAAGPHRA